MASCAEPTEAAPWPTGVILEAFPSQAYTLTRITLQAEVLKGNGALPQAKTTRVIFGAEAVEPELVSWAPPLLYVVVTVPDLSPAAYDLGLTFPSQPDNEIAFATSRPYVIQAPPTPTNPKLSESSSSISFTTGKSSSGPGSSVGTVTSLSQEACENAALAVQDLDTSSTVSFPDSSSQAWPWDENIAPVPDNESERHKELLAYRILDVDEEHMFDRLTRLAKTLFNVPIALISLLDTERQWFLSHEGLDARETPRCMAFCAFAIMKDDIFEVSNAFRDPRFANNPLVQGAPDVVFYAGAPLMTQNGFKLGTFCIIDHKPKKPLNEEQKIALHALAALTVQAMDMRRKNVAVHRSRHRLSRIARNVSVEREVFFQALDLVDQGVFVLSGDKDFEISYVNQQVENQTGYRLGQLLGQSITCLQGEKTRSGDTQRVLNILADNAAAEIVLTHHKESGEAFQHVLTFSPGWYRKKQSKDASRTAPGSINRASMDSRSADEWTPAQRGGRPDFWLVVSAAGNADEATLTRKLKREVQRTQDATVAKSRFLANMSHELRTPLNAVVGCAQILSESKTLSEADQEIVGHVTSASNVLLELIGDILDLSRVEIDAQDLVMAPFSVWEVAESIRDVFSSKAKRANLGFEVSVDDNLPTLVITDAQRFKQILVNLTGNALKFTIEGSVRIRFSFSCEDDDAVDDCDHHSGDDDVHAMMGEDGVISDSDGDISTEPRMALHRSSHTAAVAPSITSTTSSTQDPKAAWLMCDIIDTGPGIPVAHADTVFHPFTRVDESSTRKSQGSGLGLSIAQQQAHRLGGDISLTSTVGEGSTFRLRIPIQVGKESTKFVMNTSDSTPLINSAVEMVQAQRLDYIVAIVIGDRDIWGTELSSKLRAHGVQTIYTPTDEAALMTADVCVSSSGSGGITLAILRDESSPEELVWLMLYRASAGSQSNEAPQSCLMDSFMSKFSADILARTSLYPNFLSLRALMSHAIWHEARSLGIVDPAVAESALRRLDPVPKNKSSLSRNVSTTSSTSSSIGQSPAPARSLARNSSSTIAEQHGLEGTIAPEQPKVRVAIVEDSKTNQMVLNRFLKGSPFISHVSIYDHGKDIVDAWEKSLNEGNGPLADVILMDLQMPVMDGLTATRHIRRLQREQEGEASGARAGTAPFPHIIAVSADVLAGVEETCAEAGLDHYIVKPVKKPLVLNCIEAIASNGCLPIHITESIKSKVSRRPAAVTEADI